MRPMGSLPSRPAALAGGAPRALARMGPQPSTLAGAVAPHTNLGVRTTRSAPSTTTPARGCSPCTRARTVARASRSACPARGPRRTRGGTLVRAAIPPRRAHSAGITTMRTSPLARCAASAGADRRRSGRSGRGMAPRTRSCWASPSRAGRACAVPSRSGPAARPGRRPGPPLRRSSLSTSAPGRRTSTRMPPRSHGGGSRPTVGSAPGRLPTRSSSRAGAPRVPCSCCGSWPTRPRLRRKTTRRRSTASRARSRRGSPRAPAWTQARSACRASRSRRVLLRSPGAPPAPASRSRRPAVPPRSPAPWPPPCWRSSASASELALGGVGTAAACDGKRRPASARACRSALASVSAFGFRQIP
mmetsp:Transcript_34267/g.91827  ORF Transcript_34267/g.91827 Transcript_34267/m.91827 type:complete len:360 (+) Transcript_34267:733-1812(+)